MKIKLFTITLLLACMQVSAQHTEKVLQSAYAWAAASNGKDCYERAKYMNSRFLKEGVEEFVANCVKSREKSVQRSKEAAKRGANFTAKRDITFEKPGKMYEAGEEMYCIVPFGYVTKFWNKKTTIYCSLLAISADKGETWTFVEVTYMNKGFFDTYFSTFNRKAIRHKYVEHMIEEI